MKAPSLPTPPHSVPPPPIYALSGLPAELRGLCSWRILDVAQVDPRGAVSHALPPTELLAFQAALAALDNKTKCIGLELTPESDLLALRLEGAYDYLSETITFGAQKIVERLASYVDIDKRTGMVHILFRAVLPFGFTSESPKNAALDFHRLHVLGTGCCVPLTGVSISGAPCQITYAQVPLADILVELGMAKGGAK